MFEETGGKIRWKLNPTEFESGWDPTWQNVLQKYRLLQQLNKFLSSCSSINDIIAFVDKHIRGHDESSSVMDDAIHKLSWQIK